MTRTRYRALFQKTMKGRRATVILAGLTLLVLVLSVPGSLSDAFDRGGSTCFRVRSSKTSPDGSPVPVDSASSCNPRSRPSSVSGAAWRTHGRDGRRICTGCSFIDTFGESS